MGWRVVLTIDIEPAAVLKWAGDEPTGDDQRDADAAADHLHGFITNELDNAKAPTQIGILEVIET